MKPYMNMLHNIFPGLNAKKPWLDINNNSKTDDGEIVPDLYYKSRSEADNDYGKNIIDDKDKRFFLADNAQKLESTLKTKLIIESMAYIDYNLSPDDVHEAASVLEKIGEPVLPVATQYINSKDPKRRNAIYNLLLGITIQHNKFENLNFIKNVLLPKLKEQQKAEDKWPNTITGLIEKYESIVENNGIVPN